jgi:prepilin-type processing-associated H-X9-DG protein/prepilin-type N-terminal cleavage/methylation domain-containing protein
MRRNGVTMTELLVVMAALALLIGLLAPALSGVAAGSRSSNCQSNLRQITMAAQNYATMYDSFPAALRFEQVNGAYQRFAWDWVTTLSNQLVGPGPIWAFTDNPDRVQQCPDCMTESTYSGDPFTGYNYNTSFIGAEATFPQLGWANIRNGVPIHACRRTSSCAIFGDGGWKGGANKFMRSPVTFDDNGNEVTSPVHYGGGQAFRHRDWTNVAFLDGHVGSKNQPRKGKLATPNMLDQIMDYPGNGFLTEDAAAYDPR